MNNTYGVLEWTNENGLSSYPLTKMITPSDFLIDASFVQFDGFVPVLKSMTVSQSKVVLVLVTDAGNITVEIAKPLSTQFPNTVVAVTTANRKLGFLVFGQGLATIFSLYLDTTLTLNIPFLPSVVRGVNSNAGVYSIEAYTRAVNIYTGATADQSIFFDVASNNVTWNAGALPTVISTNPLKTLNGVHPIGNAVFIEDSDVIKVLPQSEGLLLSVSIPIMHGVISPVTQYE